MTPEEAYEEALSRILKAKATGAVKLDLSRLVLFRLPRELARLTSLQSLNLSECRQLSGDLSPLTSLTSLQSLNLYECTQLSGDLSSLANLTSLQSLDLSNCGQLSYKDFYVVESPTLDRGQDATSTKSQRHAL